MHDANTSTWRVEIRSRGRVVEPRGQRLCRQAEAAGILGVKAIDVRDLAFLRGDLDDATVARLAEQLLVDPVVEEARWWHLSGLSEEGQAGWSEDDLSACRLVEVTPLPGVTDAVAESLLGAARDAGFHGLQRAATGHRYRVEGDLDTASLERLARTLLANEVVQAWATDRALPPPFADDVGSGDLVELIDLRAADDDALLAISKERRLALNLEEMQAAQAWFCAAGRAATDLELEMLAQTWSEHCVHKTFRARVAYRELDVAGTLLHEQIVDSMYRTCIRDTTKALARPWLLSVFVDNAGIIAFDDKFDLAFKVETHNHPSALEPFGGANTGVGGVVRDIIGVSAAPIATTDVLCFGPPDLPASALPEGVLHPRRIADGVIDGIEDYGNKMGIPTVNGAIVYDPGYTANPLVFVGCLGVLPHGSHPTAAASGDLIVCIGGRTGRDGLRGATFSSMEMDVQTGLIAGSAVQIGHPIHEKQSLEAVRICRDAKLYSAITDCGAGGLSSAVGEMASTLGADIQLSDVPLKYAGLDPWEIWLSEAQERMVLAVPPANWPQVAAICAGLHIDATVLGHFNGEGRIRIRHGERLVGDLDVAFLHDGIPRRYLEAVWQPPPPAPLQFVAAERLDDDLLALLASPDIRSKEDVIRTYDHEVQGGTVIKPLVGIRDHGPSDAAVLVPLDTVEAAPAGTMPRRGASLAVGLAPQIGKLDPAAMAWASIDETVRNLVCVGTDPETIAILDNFCWGNPNLPDRLGGLVRCALACRDAALAFGTPFISGKDSLNNEYADGDGKRHAIPGTLLISGLGIVPDVGLAVTMDFKAAGNALYMLGHTDGRLGASAWVRLHGEMGDEPPLPQPESPARCVALHRAMLAGLVRSCHDCSEGGLAVALAEMALAGGLGAEVDLAKVPVIDAAVSDGALAFAETLGRFVIEVRQADCAAFEACFAGMSLARIGAVSAGGRLRVMGAAGATRLDAAVDRLEAAFCP